MIKTPIEEASEQYSGKVYINSRNKHIIKITGVNNAGGDGSKYAHVDYLNITEGTEEGISFSEFICVYKILKEEDKKEVLKNLRLNKKNITNHLKIVNNFLKEQGGN